MRLEILFTEDRSKGAFKIIRASEHFKKHTDEDITNTIESIKHFLEKDNIQYLEYVALQLAKNTLNYQRIQEDMPRMNIMFKLFKHYSKKQKWKSENPTDIFKFPNWRNLEIKLLELAESEGMQAEDNIEINDTREHSIILFEKAYTDENSEIFQALLGIEPTPQKIYRLRKILTPEGAVKYGRGTTWCTTTPLPFKYYTETTKHLIPRDIDRAKYYTHVPSARTEWAKEATERYKSGNIKGLINFQYLTHAALTYLENEHGLTIVELIRNGIRKPVIQYTDDQMMTQLDQPIINFGKTMRDFLTSACEAIPPKDAEGLRLHLPR